MPKWTRVLGAALLVLALASACSSDPGNEDSSTRDESGNITEGGDVGVFQLEVGDCFNGAVDGTVTQVGGVPCEQPHQSEVYATVEIEGGDDAPFPGADVIQAESEKCSGELFTEYVGIDFQSSQYQISVLNPSEDSWESGGDREVICIALTPDATATIKNTAE